MADWQVLGFVSATAPPTLLIQVEDEKLVSPASTHGTKGERLHRFEVMEAG